VLKVIDKYKDAKSPVILEAKIYSDLGLEIHCYM